MTSNLTIRVLLRIVIIAAIAFSAFGAPSEHSVERLPTCRAASATAPQRWKTIANPRGHVRFRIPPEMQQVREPKMACVHGCEEWTRGTFRVSVIHGLWGSQSFDDELWGLACAEKRGALRVVLMGSKESGMHEVVVWPVNDSSTQSTEDLLLKVQWSDAADEPDAWKVIASVGS